MRDGETSLNLLEFEPRGLSIEETVPSDQNQSILDRETNTWQSVNYCGRETLIRVFRFSTLRMGNAFFTRPRQRKYTNFFKR